MTAATREAELASSYNDLLRSDADLARSSHAMLMQAHRDLGLMIRDRPLCNVLRPRFMTQTRHDELARISSVLARLFERAGDHLFGSDRAMDLVGASDQERELWAVDPGYTGHTITSRLDSFMIGEQPRFVEYNAESPASIGFSDSLSQIFAALPIMQRWRDNRQLRPFEGRKELLQTLLQAFREWGGTGTPSIAIIDWESVLTKRDFELCGEYFRDQGVPAAIVDPRRLDYHSGRLWAGNDPVDLIYRRVLLHELLEQAAESEPLLQAYRDGAICMVNSPRSKLLHKKTVLALISDRRLGLPLSDEEQEVVDATVPWTRLLSEGETLYGEDTVDLMQFLLDGRERIVLKPSDDYGGRGVILGWETAPDEWERSLGEALEQHYIVQERVSVPQAEFPIWGEEQVEVVPLLVDSDPLLFHGHMGGILTRISGSAVLNVTAGSGSQTPTFIVEGAED